MKYVNDVWVVFPDTLLGRKEFSMLLSDEQLDELNTLIKKGERQLTQANKRVK